MHTTHLATTQSLVNRRRQSFEAAAANGRLVAEARRTDLGGPAPVALHTATHRAARAERAARRSTCGPVAFA